MTRAPRDAARTGAAVRALVKALVSLGLVVLIIHKTETKGIVERLLAVDLAVMLAAAAFVAGLAVLPALRWKILVRLSGKEFGLARLYQLLMISNFLAQAIPSIGADGVRAWYLRREGMWLAAAANSVLLDRVIALAALLLLSLASVPWLWKIVPQVVIWWLLGLIAVAAVAGAAVLNGFEWLPAAWARWRIVLMAQHMSGACRALLRSPRALVDVFGLSLVVHLALSATVYGLARALHVPVDLSACILLFPLVILVATIPIGIAGWGVREGAMVVAFGFLRMPAGDALLLSILYGIVVVLSSAPGLIFWLMVGRDLKTETTQNE